MLGLGRVVGHGRDSNELELSCPQSRSERAPVLGQFLVIEERGEGRRLLCRVEDLAYTHPVPSGGSRQRPTTEHGPGETGQVPRVVDATAPSARRVYLLRIIGEFERRRSAGQTRVIAGYRLQPDLSRVVARHLTQEEADVILRAGVTQPGRAVRIGHLAFGARVHDEQSVWFDPSRLEGRRTGVFAQHGFGKVNLCKILVSMASLACNSGILVLDTSGRFAFKTVHPTGEESLGLADCSLLKRDLVVYTNRRDVLVNSSYRDVSIRPLLNLGFLWPHQMARLFGARDQDLDLVAHFCYTPLETWSAFVNSLPTEPLARDQAISQFTDRVGDTFPNVAIGLRQKLALQRNLRSVMPLHRNDGGDTISEVLYHLANRRLVVLDLSLTPTHLALALSDLVLGEVLRFNEEGALWGRTIQAIAVFEEAEKTLSRKACDEATSTFVRWTMEGRKFGVGTIYVARQASAIAEEVLSQTENLLVTHLRDRSDVAALSSANTYFGGVTSRLIQSETIAGNVYFHCAAYQPFVLPMRVRLFGEDFARDAAAAGKKTGEPPTAPAGQGSGPLEVPAPATLVPGSALTLQEQKVLRLMVQGSSTEHMAQALEVSPLTVRNHVQHVLAKLNVHTRLEAVIYAFRYGLV